MITQVYANTRFFSAARKGQSLQLNLVDRHGERAVGQYLERLRESGPRVFHDVPGVGFNLDHVVIVSS